MDMGMNLLQPWGTLAPGHGRDGPVSLAIQNQLDNFLYDCLRAPLPGWSVGKTGNK